MPRVFEFSWPMRFGNRMATPLRSGVDEGLSKALLPHPSNRKQVAEDDEMPVVLHRLEPAPLDFREEGLAPRDPLHVADLPLDHAAADRPPRRKDLLEPDLRGQMFGQTHHAP